MVRAGASVAPSDADAFFVAAAFAVEALAVDPSVVELFVVELFRAEVLVEEVVVAAAPVPSPAGASSEDADPVFLDEVVPLVVDPPRFAAALRVVVAAFVPPDDPRRAVAGFSATSVEVFSSAVFVRAAMPDPSPVETVHAVGGIAVELVLVGQRDAPAFGQYEDPCQALRADERPGGRSPIGGPERVRAPV